MKISHFEPKNEQATSLNILKSTCVAQVIQMPSLLKK